MAEEEFRHMVRITRKDVDGNKTIASGSESKPYLSPIPKTSKGARKVPIFNEAIPYFTFPSLTVI